MTFADLVGLRIPPGTTILTQKWISWWSKYTVDRLKPRKIAREAEKVLSGKTRGFTFGMTWMNLLCSKLQTIRCQGAACTNLVRIKRFCTEIVTHYMAIIKQSRQRGLLKLETSKMDKMEETIFKVVNLFWRALSMQAHKDMQQCGLEIWIAPMITLGGAFQCFCRTQYRGLLSQGQTFRASLTTQWKEIQKLANLSTMNYSFYVVIRLAVLCPFLGHMQIWKRKEENLGVLVSNCSTK